MLPSDIATVKDLLDTWDSGSTIWSVEMGGIGPGYEQAIQVLMVELCRAAAEKPRLPEETDAGYIARFEIMRDEVVYRDDGTLGGLSGAQVGAASHLAFKFVTLGPSAALAQFDAQCPNDKDRKIQVSKDWPMVPVAKG